MPKDNRDPIDVYIDILEEKTAWHCSIVEAADRVEAQREKGIECQTHTIPNFGEKSMSEKNGNAGLIREQ
jgi:hypothetical protein